MLRQWAGTLDLVIWLEAPDAVLLERIRVRPHPHAIREQPEREAYAFLARYRRAYDEILEALTGSGQLAILRFDTTGAPPDAIADAVLGALRARARSHVG
jgi:thymidylate kinase